MADNGTRDASLAPVRVFLFIRPTSSNNTKYKPFSSRF